MENEIIDQKEYYKKIKELNIVHYAGEVSYYSKAPLRKVEKKLLSKLKPNTDKNFDYVFCPRFSINAVATFSQREKAIEEMLRIVKDDGIVFIESFNKFYLGKGIIFLLKNIIRDILRYISIFYSYLRNKKYLGLLPGDIVYKANKVKG